MSAVRADRLAEVFVEVADTLVDEFDLLDFMATVTAHAARVSGTRAAGMLLANVRNELEFIAATDESARLLELFQLQTRQGSCHDCFATGEPVINADLRDAGDRWPLFAPRATAAGYRSVHAFPLRHRDRTIGALNLFGTAQGGLDARDARVVQALADLATIGLLQEQAIRRGELLSEQLQGALNSRIVVEQAKGALSHMRGVTPDEAFVLLRDYCRTRHLRLTEVARSLLTDAGAHPDLTKRAQG